MIYGVGILYINGDEWCIEQAALKITIDAIIQQTRTHDNKLARPQFATRTGVDYLLDLTVATSDLTLITNLESTATSQNRITYSSAPDLAADLNKQISPTIWINYFADHSASTNYTIIPLMFEGIFLLVNGERLLLKSQVIFQSSSPITTGLISYQFSCVNPTIAQL